MLEAEIMSRQDPDEVLAATIAMILPNNSVGGAALKISAQTPARRPAEEKWRMVLAISAVDFEAGVSEFPISHPTMTLILVNYNKGSAQVKGTACSLIRESDGENQVALAEFLSGCHANGTLDGSILFGISAHSGSVSEVPQGHTHYFQTMMQDNKGQASQTWISVRSEVNVTLRRQRMSPASFSSLRVPPTQALVDKARLRNKGQAAAGNDDGQSRLSWVMNGNSTQRKGQVEKARSASAKAEGKRKRVDDLEKTEKGTDKEGGATLAKVLQGQKNILAELKDTRRRIGALENRDGGSLSLSTIPDVKETTPGSRNSKGSNSLPEFEEDDSGSL